MRAELQAALALARELPRDDLPRLFGELEEIRAVGLARLAAPPESKPDVLLDVEETAARMRVSTAYIYKHSRKLPFARRIGRKVLFSSAGLDNYLRKAHQ
jgi:excisionase family DNA binding protein